jgi:protein TonB
MVFRSAYAVSTFHKALAVSVLLHATLLTVHFVAPRALDRIFEPPALELVLLNAPGQSKPVKSTLLAQVSMEGGGNARDGYARNALLIEAATPGLEFQNQPAPGSVEAMRQQQNLLLSQVREQLAAIQTNAQHAVDPNPAEQQDERQRRLIQQIAALEHDVAVENARPRKRFFSPSTREAVFAAYFSELRHAVEKRGTRDFPERNGEKLFGELTMVITVDAMGRVVSTSVARSSGDAVLDNHADTIVHRAAPFRAFSPAIRASADQLVFVARFRFVHTESGTEALVE